MIANDDVKSIPATLNKPGPQVSSSFGSLITLNAINITNVNKTAICAIILFSFFIPAEQRSNTIPNPTGIRAVPDDVSKYPQRPSAINERELSKLNL